MTYTFMFAAFGRASFVSSTPKIPDDRVIRPRMISGSRLAAGSKPPSR